jgi:hypothetical protein
MVSVETVKDEIRVSIPTNGMSHSAVSALVGWLRAEVVGRHAERLRLGEAQLRRAAAKHGLNWGRLSEDQREEFVNRLLHEV